MNYTWNYDAPSPDQAALATALAARAGIHPALGKLLLDRCITTELEVRHFFRPQLTDLHDPFLMNDMQVAVARLNAALGAKERILVYGDYDVDGCTAAMAEFLKDKEKQEKVAAYLRLHDYGNEDEIEKIYALAR